MDKSIRHRASTHRPPPDPAPDRCVVLFDGACGLCERSVGWIAARDDAGRIELLAGQAEEARRRFPDLDHAALAQAMHVVAPDGTVRSGVDALPLILRRLPGRRWHWAARLLELPPIRALARPVYAWVARRRHRFARGRDRKDGAGGGAARPPD